MWSVVELFQIGVPGDWVVDLDQAELVVKMLNRSSPLGISSTLDAQDRRCLGEMSVVQIGTARSLVKGHGKEIVMRELVNDPMTVLASVIQKKIDTTIGIGTGLGTGNEEGTGREIMVVTVTVSVIVVIEIGTGIVVGIMRETVTVVMIAIVREAGTVREITSVQVMNGTVVTCMREMLNLPTVSQNMIRNMAITMSNTKAMMLMRRSAQSDMSMSTIRCNLTTQNLKALKRARHMMKVTTSITKLLMSTITEI